MEYLIGFRGQSINARESDPSSGRSKMRSAAAYQS
jgi:hypothetical protein